MAADYFSEDTIAAIVTAQNAVSAIGVIRVSGPGALQSLQPLLRKHQTGKPFSENVTSHKMYRCLVQAKDGNPLDDGMFVSMPGPNSFTGEDVVELHLHGNPFLLKRIMQEILLCGAREALPGEFSFRGFRNGKLSLDQAESISDLIGAQSYDGVRRSLGQLLGENKSGLQQFKAEIVNRLAEIEVDIDFSDQGLSVLNYELWKKKLIAWCEEVEKIRGEFLATQPLREGIRLALFGAPNSGKSSLFNRILGEDRSIVSREAGTTRDVVRESLFLGGLLVRISDTAGIRETGNGIEAEGIDRSFSEIKESHVVLWVLDGLEESSRSGSSALSLAWDELARHVDPKKVLGIWNKADLSTEPSPEIRKFFDLKKIPLFAVSAKTGLGLEGLKKCILALVSQKTEAQPSFLISRMRHFEVLGSTLSSVREAIAKVERGETLPDLLASDLRDAMSHMGEITGEFTSDDLLRHIFAEFCIGK